MGQRFVEKRKLREYAVDLMKEVDINCVIEFVKEHVHEDLGIGLDRKTDKISISCFTDYDDELESLHKYIEENYS